VRQLACGDHLEAKQLGRFDAAVARNDLLGIIDQDRVAEAKLFDALCDLLNLLARMRARVIWVRP
jgi:hypothetical protein